MSRLFDRGRAFLVRAAQQAAGVPTLTYTQLSTGHVITLTGTAWVGRTVYRSNLEGAASIEFGDRDYLIPAEVLAYNGARFEPARGDTLQETLESVTETYEIVSPDTGEPAWRWSDPQHTIFRVHTLQVS